MDKIILIAGVGLGSAIGGAILWVAFWTVLVPEALSVTWQGHEALLAPVFLVAGAVGAVAVFVSSLGSN